MHLLSHINPPVRVLSPGPDSIDNWHVVDAGGENVCQVYHRNKSVARARAFLLAHLLGDVVPIVAELNAMEGELARPLSDAQRLALRGRLQRFLGSLEGDR